MNRSSRPLARERAAPRSIPWRGDSCRRAFRSSDDRRRSAGPFAAPDLGAWWRVSMTVLISLVAAASLVACGQGAGNAAAQTAAPPAAAAASSAHEASAAPVAAPVQAAPATRTSSHRPAGTVASTHERAAATRAAEPRAGAAEAAPPRTAVAEASSGTVIRIDPIEHAAQPSGAGAVVGGVLGAVVGHQFGGGTGRTLATAAGAVGGAFAGNAVEKQHSRTVVGYRVEVRLDDGSTRSFRLGSPGTLAVGSRVRVEGSTISAA